MAVRIKAAVAFICEHPDAARFDLETATRRKVVKSTPYILIYRKTDEQIEILRLLHAFQQWA